MLALRPFDVDEHGDVVGWFTDPVDLERFAGPDVTWPLTGAALLGWCADPSLSVWSAVDDGGALVGHVQLRSLDGGNGRLCRVAVAPARRGQGVGRHLVDAVLREARARAIPEVELGVWDDNVAAIALYRSLGFQDDGEERPGVRRMVLSLS